MTEAAVTVDGSIVSAIGPGLLVLLGVEKGDTPAQADDLSARIPALRIFADAAGRMNLSVEQAGGAILVVSQFTLAATVGKGRRPGFDGAADPVTARALYDRVVAGLGQGGVAVRTGVFGAMMQVRLVNDGPVTFVIHGRP